MILIATDEAGYGPKLGPLVVAASAWQVPVDPAGPSDLHDAFSAVARPVMVDGRRIVVNDSKAVFKPQSVTQKSGGYGKLECVTLAGARWCGLADERLDLVGDLAADDRDSIGAAPWLAGLLEQTIETGQANPLIAAWESGPARLVGLKTRVITAAAFNRSCCGGSNKSDLLSQSTLELVKYLLGELTIAADEPVAVYCDRHGGRRYYAGPLQAVFDGTLVRVIAESKDESCYAVPYHDGEFTIRFTVKGDSFTPVAFSSMVAKYVREKAMESLNAYFADLAPQPLRPTAGYPVDADRFLTDIETIVREQNIDLAALVRSR
ncbi:Hypothetical protein Enr13x_56310 [Stieleria neptunia]|uniref:Ribonuclease HIII n=1 Tax=Stieleria neptunia TaxID=2527979 RepID=A0A518HY26_9BACT|nr:hypothetical protein [Stieleria neptunia]QDV45752.1 Hypothetical protein Enr13x_56310 [Stieleria neptunia]